MFLTTIALFLKSRFGRKYVPEESMDQIATPDFHDLLGQTGIALTDLRPGGKARVDGRRIDVGILMGYAEKGSTLRVIKVEGNQITVDLVAESDHE